MQWAQSQVRSLQIFVARPTILTLLIIVDVTAYFGGLLYWYGGYIAETAPPVWAWAFIPDCPLFGLLGGLALMTVTAQRYWSPAARTRAQQALVVIGGVFTLLWLGTYLPMAPSSWVVQSPTLALFGWSLLLFGFCFQHAPRWLLGLAAFGNIKYGIWTVTAWIVFWRTTNLYLGVPLFTPESIFMTLTHLGMIVQGLFLLTYFRPDRAAVVVSFFWFALSDFMDYGLGYYPPIPESFIPLPIMQWSTISVTLLLSGWYWWQSTRDDGSAIIAHTQTAEDMGPDGSQPRVLIDGRPNPVGPHPVDE